MMLTINLQTIILGGKRSKGTSDEEQTKSIVLEETDLVF